MPVIPFALNTASIVSLALTLVLLAILGVGRAKADHRRILPAVDQTFGIATAAALAGLPVGKLIS